MHAIHLIKHSHAHTSSHLFLQELHLLANVDLTELVVFVKYLDQMN